ncbi:IBR finger domain-containing protein [Arthroderma uncinatum]|uniref:IBR finger domain-containing protein n=1 Tax=Arthroderma uncinatum TaxID=74035 RepID=UPI00144AA815|nr:IBR finger domain-containing protein [Arthroderma uncinatum]KAF3492109.1 IBR finger domain-containing protein [Arthroderma uncinatum]
MASVLEPEVEQSTADLIIRLQLEDTDLYFKSWKGKSLDLTDEELAFQLQNEEFESMSQYLSDRRMATSFAAAVRADGRILADNRLEEENTAKDRDIARHWTENGCPVAAEDHQSNSESVGLDDETLAKLQILFVSGVEGYYDVGSVEMPGGEIELAESSSRAAQRTRQPQPPPLRRCIACREEAEFVNVLPRRRTDGNVVILVGEWWN